MPGGMMGDIIKADFNTRPVAYCPECGNTSWHLLLDAFGNQWEKIIGTECTNCGFIINWVLAEKEGGDKNG